MWSVLAMFTLAIVCSPSKAFAGTSLCLLVYCFGLYYCSLQSSHTPVIVLNDRHGSDSTDLNRKSLLIAAFQKHITFWELKISLIQNGKFDWVRKILQFGWKHKILGLWSLVKTTDIGRNQISCVSNPIFWSPMTPNQLHPHRFSASWRLL